MGSATAGAGPFGSFGAECRMDHGGIFLSAFSPRHGGRYWCCGVM
jgi:hypothetical protein